MQRQYAALPIPNTTRRLHAYLSGGATATDGMEAEDTLEEELCDPDADEEDGGHEAARLKGSSASAKKEVWRPWLDQTVRRHCPHRQYNLLLLLYGSARSVGQKIWH